jgi:hypothetical protein
VDAIINILEKKLGRWNVPAQITALAALLLQGASAILCEQVLDKNVILIIEEV